MKTVKSIAGRAVEFGGEPNRGWLPAGAAIPEATSRRSAVLDLRILAEDNGGVVLEYQSRNTGDSGDRWYANVAEAIREAKELLGIDAAEWVGDE
jgi:hypothetical protein